MSRRTLVLLSLLALLAGACSNKKPSSQPTPGASSRGTAVSPSASAGNPSASPGASPSSTTKPKAEKTARKVVYARAGDLWLWTASNNVFVRLTTTSAEEYDPKFIDANRISYLIFKDPTQTIYEMNLSTKKRKVLFQSSSVGHIIVHTWNPSRTTIAYLTTDKDAEHHNLRLYVPAEHQGRRVRDFGAFVGREFIDDDSIHVEFSPDGKSVLVVATPLAKGPTMFVVRSNGSNVVSGHYGTFARWSRNGKHVYFREFSNKKRWYMISVPGNVGTLWHATPGTFRPALSPDGKTWVFDDGAKNPSIFAYTIATKKQRRIGAGLDPLFLSDENLAVSNTTPCKSTEQDPCFDPYTRTFTVDRVTIATGSRKRLSLRTTNADVYYA